MTVLAKREVFARAVAATLSGKDVTPVRARARQPVPAEDAAAMGRPSALLNRYNRALIVLATAFREGGGTGVAMTMDYGLWTLAEQC